MKNWQDWIWRSLFGLLVIFFAGEILSVALTFIALASPPLANLVFCPPGQVAKISPDPFNSKTEEFGITCYDRAGSALVAFPSTDLWFLERDYFRAPSYILVGVLLVGWYLNRSMKQKMRNKNMPGV